MKSLFLPRRFLQTSNEVRLPARKSLGAKQWVIGRALCLYRLFVLDNIPANERSNALAVQLSQWSPFPETGRYVVWQGGKAQVWIWDEADRVLAAGKTDGGKAVVMPETILQEPPADQDAVRLITCGDGVEGQIWRDGILLSGYWWNALPTPERWARFLAANDLAPDTPLPEPQEKTWLAKPWARSAASGGSASLFGHEKLWLAVLGSLLLLAFVWQMTSVWKWRQGLTMQTAHIAALTRKMEPLITARAQAILDRGAAERLAQLTAYPGQLEILAAVNKAIPQKDIKMVGWHYRAGSLSFTLAGKNLNPSVYVKVFLGQPFFYEVTSARSGRPGQLTLTMKVAKKAAKKK